jgi:hypothetical protein
MHHLLCVCYTSWYFYVFSGTSLLTRCHSASSLISTVFVFQKIYTGNILGIRKAKVPIFSDTRRSPKQRRREARGQPHHRVARASPWPRHQVVGPPGPPPDAALWYVANVSIIFDAPCLFYTNCYIFCLHFVVLLWFIWTNLLIVAKVHNVLVLHFNV